MLGPTVLVQFIGRGGPTYETRYECLKEKATSDINVTILCIKFPKRESKLPFCPKAVLKYLGLG